ncbi:MAG: hypothetical protein J7L15_01070 [Clostridiales bacterium]|nr:hypothetical protein [Clostridiales bacterium]
MKAKKVEITFVAYGLTEDDALENLKYDMNGIMNHIEEIVEFTDIDTQEEGIDEFEEYISIEELQERGLTVEEDGHIFDQFGNEYRDKNGCCCFLTPQELKEYQK